MLDALMEICSALHFSQIRTRGRYAKDDAALNLGLLFQTDGSLHPAVAAERSER